MANHLVVAADIPHYLQQYIPPDLSEYEVPGGLPFPVLSFDKKQFAVKFRGEVYTAAVDENGVTLGYLDLIIVMAKERWSKTFYLTPFVQGQSAGRQPDCYSRNGRVPEPDSPNLQAERCSDCRWDAWRSATTGTGKGKACKDHKLFAAVLPQYPGGPDGGFFEGPIAVRIPPGSFKHFGQFLKEQTQVGRWPHGIVTRLTFHPQENFGVQFSFVRWISEEEKNWVDYWRQGDGMALTANVLSLEDIEDTDDAPSPVAEGAPQAQPVRSTASPVAATAPGVVSFNPRQHPQQVQPQQVQPPAQTQPQGPAPRTAAPPVAETPARAPQTPTTRQVPAPATQGRPAPRAAAGAPQPARQAAPAPVNGGGGNGSGNGKASVPAPAPTPRAPPRAAAGVPPRTGLAPAPKTVRPPAQVLDAQQTGDDDSYDVDGAIGQLTVSTDTVMATLDDDDGAIPGN